MYYCGDIASSFKIIRISVIKMTLPMIMDVSKITKIVGDYNGARPYLLVDMVVGGVNFCLGLTKVKDLYVPSSALNTDIRDLTANPSQVLSIFIKNINDDIYKKIKYVAKGLNLKNIKLPNDILYKISLENYIYKK